MLIVQGYLKCKYFWHRMDLEAEKNIIKAIEFLVDTQHNIDQQISIVSDEGVQENNYLDIERFLHRRWNMVGRLLPVIPVPLPVRAMVLKLAGRSHTDRDRTYSCTKLQQAGFRKEVSFSAALASFTDWYGKTHGGS